MLNMSIKHVSLVIKRAISRCETNDDINWYIRVNIFLVLLNLKLGSNLSNLSIFHFFLNNKKLLFLFILPVESKCFPLNPCKHGGICHEDDTSYKCTCQRGWEGMSCESKKSKSTENSLCCCWSGCSHFCCCCCWYSHWYCCCWFCCHYCCCWFCCRYCCCWFCCHYCCFCWRCWHLLSLFIYKFIELVGKWLHETRKL